MSYTRQRTQSAYEEKNIQEFIQGMTKDAFAQDKKTYFAVISQIGIIGEATKRLSDDLRSAHAHIPWKDAAAMRDVLSHDYMRIDLTIVWNVIEDHLPSLREEVQRLLAEFA